MRDEIVGYLLYWFWSVACENVGVESAMLVLLPRMVLFTAFFFLGRE